MLWCHLSKSGLRDFPNRALKTYRAGMENRRRLAEATMTYLLRGSTKELTGEFLQCESLAELHLMAYEAI